MVGIEDLSVLTRVFLCVEQMSLLHGTWQESSGFVVHCFDCLCNQDTGQQDELHQTSWQPRSIMRLGLACCIPVVCEAGWCGWCLCTFTVHWAQPACRPVVCSTYRKQGLGLPLGVDNQWLEAHCGVEAGLSCDFSHVLLPSALQEGCLWPSESSVSRQGASEVQWHFLPSLA